MATRLAQISVRALVGSVLALSAACGCPMGPENPPENPTITLTPEEYEQARSGSSDDVCSRCRGSAREAAFVDAGFFASEIEVDCDVSETAEGGAVVDCRVNTSCDAGRAPRALADVGRDEPDNWWARLALREAEAVSAFEELARELKALGAPASFVERAVAARDDEMRHAQICAAMGGVETPAAPPIDVGPTDPVAFARLNASEGCMRETFAVIDAMARSRAARQPKVRAALESIAADELRHAQLSWDIDAWVHSGALGRRAAAAADAAKRRSARQLLARAHQRDAKDCPVPLSQHVRRQLAQRFVARVAT